MLAIKAPGGLQIRYQLSTQGWLKTFRLSAVDTQRMTLDRTHLTDDPPATILAALSQAGDIETTESVPSNMVTPITLLAASNSNQEYH